MYSKEERAKKKKKELTRKGNISCKNCIYIYLYNCCLLLFSHSVMSDSLRPLGLYSQPGSSVHGILQERILEWAAIPFSRLFQTRERTCISCTAGRFFTTEPILLKLPDSTEKQSASFSSLKIRNSVNIIRGTLVSFANGEL